MIHQSILSCHYFSFLVSKADAGLDIERYLQPSLRYSMSPVQRLTEERFSLGGVDAEMESPASQVEERTVDVLETPTGNFIIVFLLVIMLTCGHSLFGGTRALTYSLSHSCLSTSQDAFHTTD